MGAGTAKRLLGERFVRRPSGAGLRAKVVLNVLVPVGGPRLGLALKGLPTFGEAGKSGG